MKKLPLLVLFLIVLLIPACSFRQEKNYSENIDLYRSYYDAVLDQDKFYESSRFFDISAEIDQKDGSYVYEVVIDNPKIAMYDVKVLVVEDQLNYDEEHMMPSVGIFENVNYHLIPGQDRKEKGYMKGFQLLSDIEEPSVNLKVILTYSDFRKLETHQEFIEFDLEYHEEEQVEEDEESKDKEDSKE